MIDVQGLTKRYGRTLAVDELTFSVREGRVTGFLGPNGAGKSTTMRVILGLDAATSGEATVKGQRYQKLRAPLREVGALLDGRAIHGGRRADDHLLGLARSNGIPPRRVGEVLDMTGLADVADRRAGGFSLGMGQRLGIAAALLGDPAVLMFDEPMNGLDTEGIRWIRDLMRRLADEGRTVFLSSHLMSEMELVADHLVVIGRGRLIADTPMRDFIERNSQAVTLIRSPQSSDLRAILEAAGAQVDLDPTGAWRVSGPDAATIGDVALRHGIGLHELTPRHSSLEDIYTRLTQSSVEYRGAAHHPSNDKEAVNR
jgi:ABC-2 type transport system ATP-binding protein